MSGCNCMKGTVFIACFHCANKIESEKHALLECPFYDDLRYRLFSVIACEILNFGSFSDDEVIYDTG